MAGPQHRTREYRAAYRQLKRDQAAGKWLTCQQPVCMEPSRAIAPTDKADVAHDDSGDHILGPAHARCNRADGGRRRHRATPTPGLRREVL